MSGLAAFPHLEFLVRHDGAVVDPFAPGSVSGCADQNLDQLWLAPLPYVPTGVLDAGFSTEVPDYAAVKEGIAALSSLTQEASALVIWATYFGPRAGDQITSTSQALKDLYSRMHILWSGIKRRRCGRRGVGSLRTDGLLGSILPS